MAAEFAPRTFNTQAELDDFLAERLKRQTKGWEKGKDWVDPSENMGWRTFENIMTQAETERENIKEKNRGARVAGRPYISNPYQNYPMEGIRNLGRIVGESVKGIAFKPEWSAKASAEQWLKERKDKAKPEERAAWEKWGIIHADLDGDKDTPDNTIILSNREAGKIRAIDGYYLKQPRWGTQNFYEKKPTKAERRVDDQTRKAWKTYFRTYKTEAEQARHPFTEFEPPQTVFNRVKAAVKSWLTELNIFIYSTKDRPKVLLNRLHITHYMAIWQKLSSFAYSMLLKQKWGLGQDYDFVKDKQNVKGKKKQKEMQEELDSRPEDHTLFSDAHKTAMREVLEHIIQDVIDAAPGGEKITGSIGNLNDGKAEQQQQKAAAGPYVYERTPEEQAYFAYQGTGKKKASRGTRSGGVVSGSSSSSTGATEMPVEDE